MFSIVYVSALPGGARLKSFILHIKDPFHQIILRRNVETFADNYESNQVVWVQFS